MGWLDGETALITGGASGLGLALAHRFLEEGARVAIMDRSPERLAAAHAQLGAEVVAIAGDVTRIADNRRAVAAAEERFGKLDCFVGNAGMWDFMTKLEDLPDDESLESAIDELLGTNVKGYILGAKAALPSLARSGGSIIFTLSNAAFAVAGGGPLYTASKHAGVGLVRQLAHELAPRVRVNAVAPGAISTDLRGPESLGLASTSIAGVPLADFVPEVVPMGFLPAPEEYAGPYVLLASRRNSSSATASIINIDGGMAVRGFPRPGAGYDLAARFARADRGNKGETE
jgi:NAD(P)-dependent dehydrogenase (short-subunit alcohol dehydrogenase family)